MEELLTAVKAFLDITGTDRDEDIKQIIQDALFDMARVGILSDSCLFLSENGRRLLHWQNAYIENRGRGMVEYKGNSEERRYLCREDL